MILAQTLFSVRTGSERRAEGSLGEIDRLLEQASGQRGHRILRSFGMSPLASALRDEAGEATLGQLHYVVKSEWDSLDEHDAFYRSEALQMGLPEAVPDPDQRSLRSPLRGGCAAPRTQRCGTLGAAAGSSVAEIPIDGTFPPQAGRGAESLGCSCAASERTTCRALAG